MIQAELLEIQLKQISSRHVQQRTVSSVKHEAQAQVHAADIYTLTSSWLQLYMSDCTCGMAL